MEKGMFLRTLSVYHFIKKKHIYNLYNLPGEELQVTTAVEKCTAAVDKQKNNQNLDYV